LHKGLKFSPQNGFKERWLPKQLESLPCFEQKTCRQACFPTLRLSWGLPLLLTSQNITPQNKHRPLLDRLLLRPPWPFLQPGSSSVSLWRALLPDQFPLQQKTSAVSLKDSAVGEEGD